MFCNGTQNIRCCCYLLLLTYPQAAMCMIDRAQAVTVSLCDRFSQYSNSVRPMGVSGLSIWREKYQKKHRRCPPSHPSPACLLRTEISLSHPCSTSGPR
ncbi:hypothetical protein F5Y08DRAFT_306024, partial [Xylaria arbuscula]